MAEAAFEQPRIGNVAPWDPATFTLGVADEGGVDVAWLSGELDVATAPWLTDSLALPSAERRRPLILDLSRLDFLDAAGLGAIIRVRNALRLQSRELLLRAPSRPVARLLAITGLTGLVMESRSN